MTALFIYWQVAIVATVLDLLFGFNKFVLQKYSETKRALPKTFTFYLLLFLSMSVMVLVLSPFVFPKIIHKYILKLFK